MKNFIKNNIKVIFAIIVIAVLCISGTVYATTKYLSSDVTYKDTTVENALNDLYDISNNSYNSQIVLESGLRTFVSLTYAYNQGYKKFKVLLPGNGTGASCKIYTSNVGDNVLTLNYDTLYDTHYSDISNYRISLNATGSWCSFNVYFYK